jgi:protein-S-isoprenylcysteine O-methyltransferase Ste14
MMNVDMSVQETQAKSAPNTLVILLRIVILMVLMGAILFGLAGRINWTMGWAYMAALTGVSLLGVASLRGDAGLIEERTQLKPNTKSWDKPIAILLSLFIPLGLLIVAGLDMRYGWSDAIPVWLQITSLIVGTVGFLLSYWAMATNRFYARFVRIQKERNHSVVSSGPYRVVRHPGYVGSSIFTIGTALALNSTWALLLAVVLIGLLVFRTALEDRTLHNELEGYKEYAARVRYRLLPGIW